jgi:hypothetical protein
VWGGLSVAKQIVVLHASCKAFPSSGRKGLALLGLVRAITLAVGAWGLAVRIQVIVLLRQDCATIKLTSTTLHKLILPRILRDCERQVLLNGEAFTQ